MSVRVLQGYNGGGLTVALVHDSLNCDLVAVHKRRELGRHIAWYVANLCATDVLHLYSVTGAYMRSAQAPSSFAA